MDIGEAQKLRALDTENSRLKKLLAESQLENSILKEVAAKNSDGARAARRAAWLRGLRAQPRCRSRAGRGHALATSFSG